jgi:prepilin-type processing-associated H-X9-DG protein
MTTSYPERRSTSTTRGKAITWIVVGLFVLFLMYLFLPGVGSGPISRRSVCRFNLKQLAIAMHNYHEVYGSFPPAYIADKSGRRMHSWRVLLLPFMESSWLHKQYRFDEPWNGPHNRLLAEKAPEEFHCPVDTGAVTDSSYFVVVGPKTVFPGAVPIAIKDITDGTPNTVLIVEAADSGINWLEPRDLSYAEAIRGLNPKSGWGISSHHPGGGALVAFADGSVRYLPDNTSVDQLRRILERNDGQPVSWPEN